MTLGRTTVLTGITLLHFGFAAPTASAVEPAARCIDAKLVAAGPSRRASR
jgi:hypothetical protein